MGTGLLFLKERPINALDKVGTNVPHMSVPEHCPKATHLYWDWSQLTCCFSSTRSLSSRPLHKGVCPSSAGHNPLVTTVHDHLSYIWFSLPGRGRFLEGFYPQGAKDAKPHRTPRKVASLHLAPSTSSCCLTAAWKHPGQSTRKALHSLSTRSQAPSLRGGGKCL